MIKESALLDMAPDLSKQCSGTVCANASLRYNATIIGASIVKHQQFIGSIRAHPLHCLLDVLKYAM